MKGRLDFVCFFIVFRSVVFVNWGGEFFVKHMKIEGFEFGPVVIFKKIMTNKQVLGGDFWATKISKIIEKPKVCQ